MAFRAYIFGDSRAVEEYEELLNRLRFPMRIAVIAGENLVITPDHPLVIEPDSSGDPVDLVFTRITVKPGGKIIWETTGRLTARELIYEDDVRAAENDNNYEVIGSPGGPGGRGGDNNSTPPQGAAGQDSESSKNSCTRQAGSGSPGQTGGVGGLGGNGRRGGDGGDVIQITNRLEGSVNVLTGGGDGGDGGLGGAGGAGGAGGRGGNGDPNGSVGQSGASGSGGNGGRAGDAGSVFINFEPTG